MKESRIYNLRLCEYLLKKGFRYKQIVPDAKKEGFLNWLFEDTPELHDAIHDYLQKK